MIRNTHITVIGGDARQVYAADHLAKAGYTVTTFGLSSAPQSAKACQTYADAVQNAEIVLLPLPMSRDHLQITGTELSLSVFQSRLRQGMTVFCGMPDTSFVHSSQEIGVKVVDYASDEVFMIRNALPTAEGAVAIAMGELRRTLFGSKIFVVGYGRIGKLLSELLKSMGAEVTVAARKMTDLTLASLHGCKPHRILPGEEGSYYLPALPEAYHVIFNTAPVRLIHEELLRHIPKDTVLIDLASAPGGIDYDTANRLGLKTVIALSLPGKVAPITAGEIIGDLVMSHLREEETSP